MPRTRDRELLRAVGARLKKLRSDRGWTQQVFAEIIGVEPISVSRFETGERAMSLAVLALCAEKLGVGIADLVDVERPVPPGARPSEAEEAARIVEHLDPQRRDLAVRVLREFARRPRGPGDVSPGAPEPATASEAALPQGEAAEIAPKGQGTPP